ncbi:hypothetical protein EB796_001133 [Bugula neritina]|uniref:Uncharacterized protein n=1 Tax=Bugula neritina TaxID=10212 RepID=A0A7J7KQV7_BUGNE|nr:hypothetical protein EB796_001133 [Bugula neritina]
MLPLRDIGKEELVHCALLDSYCMGHEVKWRLLSIESDLSKNRKVHTELPALGVLEGKSECSKIGIIR